ncbi:hypothetical protein [uncultured Veillonella sp.]|uniref:hypothetical protein n=1 Tax=uncultured Veillonella sp. TaxID=159268 RepID=UPI0025888EA6|nr:hypothetical protein [uncultured Veillonella sp.]
MNPRYTEDDQQVPVVYGCVTIRAADYRPVSPSPMRRATSSTMAGSVAKLKRAKP